MKAEVSRRATALTLLVAFLVSSFNGVAFAQSYDWLGDHACTVKKATTIRRTPIDRIFDGYAWNIDDTFILRIRQCRGEKPGGEFCGSSSTGVGMTIQYSSRKSPSPRWRPRIVEYEPFETGSGEALDTFTGGNFRYIMAERGAADGEGPVNVAWGNCIRIGK